MEYLLYDWYILGTSDTAVKKIYKVSVPLELKIVRKIKSRQINKITADSSECLYK